MEHLKVPSYPRPYYLSYLLRDVRTCEIWGRLGNINFLSERSGRNLYCDCRVGSYRYDQVAEGGLEDNSTEVDSFESVEMPIGNDVDALKYHIWRLTDSRYREAVRDLMRKKSHHITFLDTNRKMASFRRAEPIVDQRFKRFSPVALKQFEDFVKRSSRVVKHHPEVKNSWVEVRVRDITRIFVNSEGSRLLDQSRCCELSCDLWLLSPEGEGISARISHMTSEISGLPGLRTFNRQIRERIKQIKELASSPPLKSYAGPVLLMPQPAGILMHEVLGHRLEGSRLLSAREGQTFKQDLGKKILPEFLSVSDDPRSRESHGIKAVGCYRYDDEGSPAQRAELVRQGVLVGFLSGRAPVTLKQMPGNGHARNEYHERPISRMAHLEVTTQGGLPHDVLKQRFIEEIKRQGLPFGIMVLDAEGGETATESYNFQAFRGTIALALQVWTNGRENLVRNVNFVGTPLTALRTIMAAGNTPLCVNAYCGAESGMIPVSTTCPALLLSNLELQAKDQRKYAQYVLPMPFEKAPL